VQVVGDGPIDAPAVTEILGLRIGQQLDRRQLRETIHALYAGADVEWLRVEASEGPDGLAVLVRISYLSEIAKVEVRTRNPVLKKRVQKWLELQPGTRVTASGIEAARRRVLRRIQERGHPLAKVDVYVEYRRASNTAIISVQMDAGAPQVLGNIVLSGIDDPEVAAEARPDIKAGSRLTAKLVNRIRDQTESGLRGLGFWDAQVVDVDRYPEGAEVTVDVEVVPGPRYELQLFTDEEHEKRLRSAIPDPAEEDIHPAQTDALAERIRERLQQEGYLLAQVDAEIESIDGTPILRVRADPGTVRRVAEVDFPGARSVSEKRLQSAVRVHPGPVRGLRGRKVTDTTLEQDRRAMNETMRSYGFVEATVSSPILEPIDERFVKVSFPVDEGDRWILTDLRIEGLPVESAGRLEQVDLGLVEAAPWNPRQVEVARRQLELILADTGYPEGRVEATVDTSVVGEAKVLYQVQPGNSVRIGKVVIAGLTKTRESVVARTIRRAGVVTGEPYARDRILQAQRQLYALGLFRRVELLAMPGQERRSERGLVVVCEEGRQRSYLLGVGWNETDRFRITLGWSNLNLFGGAHAFSTEVRFSSREERIQIGLREPWVPKLNAPAYLVIFRTFEDFPERGYDQRRSGLWIDAGDRLERPFRKWLRYEYQIVNPEGEPIEREDQESRISSLTPTLEWDYRDDPLVPTRGTLTSVSLQWAFPLFRADSEYLKLYSQFSLYGRMLDGVGSFGVRVGAIEPLGAPTEEQENLEIPVSVRFFSGGASSHRAFLTDTLGLPGQTIDPDGRPVGGNALVLINFEYTQKISSMFSGVVFMDIGNVFESPSFVSVSDLRWGAGLGLRYDTPAGPLRAEYGWKLDREPDESAGQFFLSFGIPF
jgi:outer membrane protein insertion porin family